MLVERKWLFSLFKSDDYLSENVVSYALIFESYKIEIYFIYYSYDEPYTSSPHQLNLPHHYPQQDQN